MEHLLESYVVDTPAVWFVEILFVDLCVPALESGSLA